MIPRQYLTDSIFKSHFQPLQKKTLPINIIYYKQKKSLFLIFLNLTQFKINKIPTILLRNSRVRLLFKHKSSLLL